jgi:hypothetical protein
MSIKVRVNSNYALWKMPASGPDPVSSAIPSQAALRGIIERKFRPCKGDWVYAKEVIFLKEPRLIELARNGHSSFSRDARLQRHMMVLYQPDYLVEYEVVTRGDEAHRNETYARLRRSLQGVGSGKKGARDMIATAGESSFIANVEWLPMNVFRRVREQRIRKTFDYGLQYYGLDYADREHPKPIMFLANMIDGIVTYPFLSECFQRPAKKEKVNV